MSIRKNWHVLWRVRPRPRGEWYPTLPVTHRPGPEWHRYRREAEGGLATNPASPEHPAPPEPDRVLREQRF